jgi:hypothetical protein
MYSCEGTISEETGECSGSLKVRQIKHFHDNCLTNNFPKVNHYACLSSNSEPIYMTYYGNKILCETDSQDALFMKYESVNKLCSKLATSAVYKYYTKGPINPKEIQGFKCDGTGPAVCVLSTSLVLTDKPSHPLNY